MANAHRVARRRQAVVKFEARLSGKCIDEHGASNANGAAMQLSDRGGRPVGVNRLGRLKPQILVQGVAKFHGWAAYRHQRFLRAGWQDRGGEHMSAMQRQAAGSDALSIGD